jgi:hypothetical protein
MALTSRSFGARCPGPSQSSVMATAEQQQHHGVDEAAVLDWRFGVLTQAGYTPDEAWMLAACRGVDVRLAERLLVQGCPRSTAVRILL